jgi:hypothetical protein
MKAKLQHKHANLYKIIYYSTLAIFKQGFSLQYTV